MNNVEELQQLYARFKENFNTIEQCRQNNQTIHERIKELELQVRQNPIEIIGEKTLDNGGKCFICGFTSSVVCQICLTSNSPCGYCDRHRSKHNTEFGASHLAVFRMIVKPQLTEHEKYVRKKLSPEEELAQLEARIAELKEKVAI